MKRNLSICLFVVIMTLVGCSNSTVTTPDAGMFNIIVDTSTDLQAGESILLTGKLVNHSDSSWELEHGADMFTYDVYDSNGNRVSQSVEPLMVEGNIVRMVNSIGFMKSLQPMEQYSNDGEGHVYPKNNEYILPAGNYTIVSKAKFRIKHDGTGYEFEIESEPLSIKVT